jgi:hypothetical protein
MYLTDLIIARQIFASAFWKKKYILLLVHLKCTGPPQCFEFGEPYYGITILN